MIHLFGYVRFARLFTASLLPSLEGSSGLLATVRQVFSELILSVNGADFVAESVPAVVRVGLVQRRVGTATYRSALQLSEAPKWLIEVLVFNSRGHGVESFSQKPSPSN